MISPTLESLRLFLHVLAASVWVGGQLVLGALVPRLRGRAKARETGAATGDGMPSLEQRIAIWLATLDAHPGWRDYAKAQRKWYRDLLQPYWT